MISKREVGASQIPTTWQWFSWAIKLPWSFEDSGYSASLLQFRCSGVPAASALAHLS